MVHGQPFDKGGPIPFFPVPTSSRRQDFFTSFQQSPNTLQVSAPMCCRFHSFHNVSLQSSQTRLPANTFTFRPESTCSAAHLLPLHFSDSKQNDDV